MIDGEDDAHRPLPMVLRPVEDELLSSWLARHAAYYGVTRPFFAKWLMLGTSNLSVLDHRLGLAQVARLSEKLRRDPIALIAMTFIDASAGSAELICRNRAPQICRPCADRHGREGASGAIPRHWRKAWRVLLAARPCQTQTSVPITAKHCATPAHSRAYGKKPWPVRRSLSASFTATAPSTIRRSLSCARCSSKLGGLAARMVATPLSAGRSARSFPNSTISRDLSSAESIMPPLRRCLSLSVPPFWQASRKRSQIPTPSALFGMRRSCGGEERSNACAKPLGSKLKRRGKAIKCENIFGRYSHI
jgi:hypothetical protein